MCHVHEHVCMYIYICICTCKCTCMCIRTCICTFIRTCICICICICGEHAHLHQLQQLLTQLGVVGQQDGLPLGVNPRPASSARHLAILGCTQHTVFALDTLVVMPAYSSCWLDLSAHIRLSMQLISRMCPGFVYPISTRFNPTERPLA